MPRTSLLEVASVLLFPEYYVKINALSGLLSGGRVL